MSYDLGLILVLYHVRKLPRSSFVLFSNYSALRLGNSTPQLAVLLHKHNAGPFTELTFLYSVIVAATAQARSKETKSKQSSASGPYPSTTTSRQPLPHPRSSTTGLRTYADHRTRNSDQPHPKNSAHLYDRSDSTPHHPTRHSFIVGQNPISTIHPVRLETPKRRFTPKADICSPTSTWSKK